MPKLVVDSSVIVKWLNQTNENYTDQSNRIMEDVRKENSTLFTPELAKYETGNVLLKSRNFCQLKADICLYFYPSP